MVTRNGERVTCHGNTVTCYARARDTRQQQV